MSNEWQKQPSLLQWHFIYLHTEEEFHCRCRIMKVLLVIRHSFRTFPCSTRPAHELTFGLCPSSDGSNQLVFPLLVFVLVLSEFLLRQHDMKESAFASIDRLLRVCFLITYLIMQIWNRCLRTEWINENSSLYTLLIA